MRVYNAPMTTNLGRGRNLIEEWREWMTNKGLEVDENLTCYANGCNGHADRGAHVLIEGNELNGWLYIIPKCRVHNDDTDFRIDEVPDDELMPVRYDGEYRAILDVVDTYRKQWSKIVNGIRTWMPFHEAVVARYGKEEDKERVREEWVR